MGVCSFQIFQIVKQCKGCGMGRILCAHGKELLFHVQEIGQLVVDLGVVIGAAEQILPRALGEHGGRCEHKRRN